MTNRKRIWKWNARKNADRFHHPGGPQARQKAFRRNAQPAPARGCSRGLGGAATNKQNERLAGRRDVHFSHDGTIMPCLPVSPPQKLHPKRGRHFFGALCGSLYNNGILAVFYFVSCCFGEIITPIVRNFRSGAGLLFWSGVKIFEMAATVFSSSSSVR